MKKILKNAEVVTGGQVRELDLLIEGDRIAGLFERGAFEGEAEEFDCSGKVILPGLIDAHVHFREPGATHKEDFGSGSRAAVAGGVTTVFDMPNNTPAIVDRETLQMKRELVGPKAYCNFGLFVAYNGRNIEELNEVEGVPGVKIYVANSTGDMGVGNEALPAFFERTNKQIVVHAEDAEIIDRSFERFRALVESGEAEASVHSQIRDPEAEKVAIELVCSLAKKFDKKLHIAHLTTAAGLEIVVRYRAEGARVTAEVSPHHLNFSVDDYAELGNFLRVNPPVRSREDVFELWKGLKAGEIDIVATDHAPHTFEEKRSEDYVKVPSGVPGVETMLPVLLSAVNDDALTLVEMVRLTAERPAELYGVQGRGAIVAGNFADLVVVDMEKEHKVLNSEQFSRCGWSPFAGRVLKGWPVMTFVNGGLVFADGQILGEPQGREVEFGDVC